MSPGCRRYADAVAGTDWGASKLEGAVAGMTEFSQQHFALVDIAAASEKAFDDLSTSVDKNGKTFDVATEKGRANQSALEDVAKTLDTQFAAAYTDAGGDLDVFKGKAASLAAETLTRLQKELGLSDQQTAELAASLGLLPEDIETRYNLSGDAEAKVKIGLLQTSINNLPENVQTKVTQQIITGDYKGALATVQNYYDGHPATIYTTVDLARAQAQIASFFRGLGTPAGRSAAPAAAAVVPLTVAPAAAAPTAVYNITNNVQVPRIPSGRELARISERWARVNGAG